MPRKSYSREFKLKAVDFCASYGLTAAAKRYGVDNSLITRWKTNINKIQAAKPGSKSYGSGRKCWWPILEEKIYNKLMKKREKGFRIGPKWIILNAKKL